MELTAVAQLRRMVLEHLARYTWEDRLIDSVYDILQEVREDTPRYRCCVYKESPSAHVFEDKIYIYPSHDLDHDGEDNDDGDQYKMEDYHILSMDDVDAPCVDHGEALHMKDVPWVIVHKDSH